MGITRIHLKNFTAFDDLDMQVSPGLNVLIGENGTGKTHLMKVAYAACDITRGGQESEVFAFIMKLGKVFHPWSGDEDLIRYKRKSNRCEIEVYWNAAKISEVISSERKHLGKGVSVKGPPRSGSDARWAGEKIESVYIPPKDILANGPGFLSLYNRRDISFDETYADLLYQAYLPRLKEKPPLSLRRFLLSLQKIMGGRIEIEGEAFFLTGQHGKIEFNLVAEGHRKLGLLWLLLQNFTLAEGSVLFFDEPEANLNPSLYGVVIEILLELQRMGVQIFIATHDYVILKEIDLRMKPTDAVMFHSLYKDSESKEVKCHSTSDYLSISPNAIADTFTKLYDQTIRRSLGI